MFEIQSPQFVFKGRIALITAAILVVLAPAAAHARSKASQFLIRPDSWFSGAEAGRITTNILSWQSDLGGWPKNMSTTDAPYGGTDRQKELPPTFDNGATTDELRFLARRFNAVHDAPCETAFLRGLDYILVAQYPTGGWPQFYPPSKQYHRHITFNDDAMVRLMYLLREVYSKPAHHFVDGVRKAKARAEFDKGIECILRCQIKVNGKLTAWCAQHDELDYKPAGGRTYELPSLSGAESVGIVRLLMSLERPDPEVSNAVESAVTWFDSSKLKGIRVVRVDDPKAPRGKDKRVVEDPSAPPLWARFYEIGSNRPIFCDRDGIAKSKLSDIGYERRNGYSWLGDWPKDLLEREYPQWKKNLPKR